MFIAYVGHFHLNECGTPSTDVRKLPFCMCINVVVVQNICFQSPSTGQPQRFCNVSFTNAQMDILMLKSQWEKIQMTHSISFQDTDGEIVVGDELKIVYLTDVSISKVNRHQENQVK